MYVYLTIYVYFSLQGYKYATIWLALILFSDPLYLGWHALISAAYFHLFLLGEDQTTCW